MPPEGLEPAPESSGNTAIPETGSAESGAHSDDSGSKAPTGNPTPDPLTPDLRALVDAWPDLPPAVRAGILAMVEATR